MCELFGLTGKKNRQLNAELGEFFSHAEENPNGWGLAIFDKGREMLDKEEKRADRSRRLRKLMSSPVEAANLIAHIRLATIGYDEFENTHPFTGTDISYRTWTLAHNGTIFESGPLSPFFYVQNGFTDSERILLYIIDRINRETETKGRALDAKERFEVLDGIITRISYKNKLNLLIHDGEITYVHTNFRDSLYQRVEDGSVFFSSRPLSTGAWEHVPFMRLIGYREDEAVFEGTAHDHEYFPDECSLNALYLAYSGL